MSNEQKNGGGLSKAAQLAQLAKGVSDTIKGAMVGGLKGAAVAAAKAFAPQLIKAAIAVILFFLLLPTIIYFAMPNMFFQYPSVSYRDVGEMNEQSELIASLYEQMDGFTQQEADKIIAELSAGYDESTVSSDFTNINRYWLIVISTVLHNQSMNIGEDAVRGLIRQNLDYSYTTESWEEEVGTDEEGDPIYETRTRINISIENTNHDTLMEKLGFTQFQKDWAYFLYNNITDSQLVPSDYPDWTGNPGELTDYGDLVFTDGSHDVVYYNQADARWGHYMYGKYHTIAVGGCGPTALAMVVSSMTDTTIDPKEMADWSYDNGYCAEGNGSYHALIPNGAAHFGISVTGAGRADGQKIIDALADGKLVVALMGPGHFTTGGHFIVLRGITSEGNVLVADPISVRKTGMEWDMRIIMNEASRKAVAGGPFWICE